MKTIQITALIAATLFSAGTVLAAGGQGRRGNGNGNGGPPQSGQNRGSCQQDCPNGNDGSCDRDCDRVRQGQGQGSRSYQVYFHTILCVGDDAEGGCCSDWGCSDQRRFMFTGSQRTVFSSK